MLELRLETRLTLERYKDGQISNQDLAEWLVGVEYDPEFSAEERDALAALRLVTIEVFEGDGQDEDILRAVARVLVEAEPGSPVVTVRSGSATTWTMTTTTRAGSQARYAGISP